MAQAFASPGKYIQGYNELARIGKHAASFGSSALVLCSRARLHDLQDIIADSFKNAGIQAVFEPFGGECTKQEVERLRSLVKNHQSDLIVGLGGGKAIDTAKAVAYHEKTPVVIVPTVASCDAPTSSVVIFYNEDGAFQEALLTRRNPNLVLVDTRIIANAPVRLLVAGMGDALATYFEARTCVQAHRRNLAGGTFTLASYALAELCYRTLLSDGLPAVLAVQSKVVTKALDNVIEANTLLSGIGFESNGVATAHAIYDGFTVIPGARRMYHGEWVAFGTVVQLVLENRPRQELDEVLGFCRSVGLPTTLKDLGMENIGRDQLLQVAQAATAPKESIHNEPFPVTPDDVVAAILVADALGREYRGTVDKD
ncbi:glycerol dehydrogenase [Anaeroselena agilis]|uniref:Glycerol dehydrogenase n=1 Tax=Anaeroselena agilis TaxID=3063788 RepID=A0ABU3P277_9FIRM|nr:glycerol dehydrogenase [Selenomonadales bacterium 4137-cl]